MSLTTNENFHKMYEMYKNEENVVMDFLINNGMGRALDPHNEDLTYEAKLFIRQEAINNLWYFLSETVRIPVINGDPVKFNMNKSTLSALYLSNKNVNNAASIPRQCWGTMAYSLFILWSLLKNKRAIIISERRVQSIYVLERILDANRLLPHYIRMSDEYIKERVRPTAVPRSYRHCREFVEAIDEDIIFLNDYEFISVLPTMMPEIAMNISPDQLLIMESVIGKTDSSSKKFVDAMLLAMPKWNDDLYKFNFADLAFGGMFNINYEYTEIVDNPTEWVEFMKRMLSESEDAYKREVLLDRGYKYGNN